GTEIQLFGEIDPGESNSATYQIDSQPPQPFQLFASRPLSNQMLFNISGLEPGEHSLVV
ncbi:hypothetical protein L218DRAFT_837790, partial [Marasmius fiardii PR-910]